MHCFILKFVIVNLVNVFTVMLDLEEHLINHGIHNILYITWLVRR